MTPISIVLVDDHQVVTHSLKAYLESFADLKVIGMAATGEELLLRLDEWNPQVILQDLLLPGGIDGIETTRRVLARRPDVAVVALTASMDEARMIGALRAGARGYVRKDAAPETLLAAVRAVARGRTYIDPSIGRDAIVPEVAHRARDGSAAARRARTVEQGHRGGAVGAGGDGEDARHARPRQARRRQPGTGDRAGAQAGDRGAR